MKHLSIASLVVFASFITQAASAQITNGSFETGDYTGWQTLGGTSSGPVVLTSGPTTINGMTSNVQAPVQGTFQAFLQSTGSASPLEAASVTGAGGIDSFVGTTLPGNGVGTPTNGQAIQQTFTVAGNSSLTFSYSYQSREGVNTGFDETGYVLNGVFHILVDTNTAGVSPANSIGGVFGIGLPYQTITISAPSGTDTLSFVTYNTGDELATTGLFVDDVFLNLLTPAFATIPGLTPNQTSVAQSIDMFSGTVTTGNFGTLVMNLTNLANNDPAALGAALDQLSPQSLQIFRHIAFDNATFTTQEVTNHLANLRDGLTGFDGSQLTVTDSTLSPMLSQINSRLLAWNPSATPGLVSDTGDPVLGGIEMKDTKQMKAAVSEPADPWSTFISGNVILADLSHDQDLAHQDYTTGSVMLGLDYRLDNHFTVGAFFAYGHTDADLDENGSTATVDTYSPGIYASYVDGGWYGNALFAYGYNSYTEDRNISIGDLSGTNQGAPQGNQYTGSMTGGYEFQRGNFKFGPIASVQYVNLGIDSFSEEGPTALNVASESDESFRSQLGVEARYVVHAGSVAMTPHASATWQHEFLDGSDGITSQFNQIGAGSFTVQTTETERDSAFVDVGVNADVADNMTLFTDYQTEAGQDHYFAQSVQAGVKVRF
jgi:outer membrane autotransporter protein